MLSLGTPVAFACNQSRNFALWCDGKPMDNLDPEVTSLAKAYKYIANTQNLLSIIDVKDLKPDKMTRIALGLGAYLELSSNACIHKFTILNFYFYLVTAYDILRMVIVPIGKRDYMLNLVLLIKQA